MWESVRTSERLSTLHSGFTIMIPSQPGVSQYKNRWFSEPQVDIPNQVDFVGTQNCVTHSRFLFWLKRG